jgi:hypothetical protein
MTPNAPAPHTPHVQFPCPLCLDASGREVTITAELDLTTPLVAVADLSGCPHAQAFGTVGLLTIVEEARLINAALDAHETQREGDDGGQRCAGDSR